jgi:hypothetical protein
LDRKGDRVEQRLDRKGDRINNRLDRRGERHVGQRDTPRQRPARSAQQRSPRGGRR